MPARTVHRLVRELRRLAAPLAAGLLLGACAHAPAVTPEQLYGALRLPHVGGHPAPRLQGHVVLVHFFATWCFPCLAELPVLERLQKDHQDQGFTVLAVGLDREGAKVLGPFAEQYQLPFPVLVASDAVREGRSVFGPIRAVPAYVLIDREGKVAWAYEGVGEPSELLRAVSRAVR